MQKKKLKWSKFIWSFLSSSSKGSYLAHSPFFVDSFGVGMGENRWSDGVWNRWSSSNSCNELKSLLFKHYCSLPLWFAAVLSHALCWAETFLRDPLLTSDGNVVYSYETSAANAATEAVRDLRMGKQGREEPLWRGKHAAQGEESSGHESVCRSVGDGKNMSTLKERKMLGQVRSVRGLCRMCVSSLPFRSVRQISCISYKITLCIRSTSMQKQTLLQKPNLPGLLEKVVGNVCSHLVNIDWMLKAWGQPLLGQAWAFETFSWFIPLAPESCVAVCCLGHTRPCMLVERFSMKYVDI